MMLFKGDIWVTLSGTTVGPPEVHRVNLGLAPLTSQTLLAYKAVSFIPNTGAIFNPVSVTLTPHAHLASQTMLSVETTTIGGPSVINLSPLAFKREMIIYDNEGSAPANPITVNAPVGHNISGVGSAIINGAYGALRLFYDGTTNWRIL